ncbi:hypothetical protein [[Phormidium] sp. ETS-05]|uniref:hypothetical protein n=1 Tax=[Phormidium] sp. ETS-05 TaxID=222819 RepID=UPI0018EEEFD9|nr:hypothetical protein [[Phormidium] sp. ETS-05]
MSLLGTLRALESLVLGAGGDRGLELLTILARKASWLDTFYPVLGGIAAFAECR